MTPEQFTYWLQGFAEISQKAPSEKEWTIIKDHLATVFNKVTPNRQIYPLGPGIAQPATEPLRYPYTTIPAGPYTTSPTLIRPEVTCCSPAPGAGTNWKTPGAGGCAGGITFANTVNAAGGMGFGKVNLEDLK